MHRNLYLLFLFLTGCATRTSEHKDILLRGILSNDGYRNSFFSMKLPNGWHQQDEGSDDSQFLILVKDESDFKSNLIFLASDRQNLRAQGFSNTSQYAKAFYNHNTEKVNFKIVKGLDSMLISNRYFYRSVFSFPSDGRMLQQSIYMTEMRNYVLGIVCTEDLKSPDPNIEKMIRTIIFKN